MTQPTAEQERAAIVAWLRKQATQPKIFNLDPISLGLVLDYAGSAIERGSHLAQKDA